MVWNKLAVVTAAAVIGGAVLTGFMSFAAGDSPTEWEHGFKTDRVVATRYTNPMIGFNIGFRYLNAHDDDNADTDRVMKFFEGQNCGIYEGGGASHSEYYVQCKNVTDVASANIKLKTLLPALEAFMRTL